MKLNHFTLLLLLIATACVSNKETPHADADSAIPVSIQNLASQQLPNEILLSGSIEGKTTVNLAFMVPGKVEYISHKEGETITNGQLLSRLELTSYTLNKELSDVQVVLAKDEFTRLSLMYKAGSLSESDFTKAGMAVTQAELQKKIQEKNIADAHIYSPLNGVLLSKQTEVGEAVSAGVTLFVVADIRKVIVTAYIPEGELHQVAIGQMAEVHISALNQSFPGKVTDVGAVADMVSRAFTVKIEIDNKDLLIRPGMIAEARIAGNRNEHDILIPTESVVHDLNNQNYIYIADIKQQKAFKRKISLGRIVENKIQVVSGLSTGETIVVDGQSKLADGAHITIIK
ncbi:efflux RND transporter periplasmic adaptor subunit [Chryseolinea soli]|uniref:Efflux RND transporter periplasmic adaptor subunit n=1 Tax=Chryseolinea soli TaxID=2321403 RepID=A0A385SL31_9BACT|nr:efflux RND transporter periplasmic adaptor subunit [Chryseolinea soli]AYB31949.1 efflux RND transporter periplasmic adaptor subunit [Chryseolinea soli]